jgi:hypothetical protein
LPAVCVSRDDTTSLEDFHMRHRTVFLLAALALSCVARAQLIIISNPTPPALVSPQVDATVKGIRNVAGPGNTTTLAVSWIEYGILSTLQQPLPSHFVVCVKLASQAQNCAFAPADFKSVGSLDSSKVYNSSWQFVGYQYKYTLPAGSLTDNSHDEAATWSVGACRGAVASLCSFSAPRALWISTRDLNANHIADRPTSTNAVFVAESMNGGTSTIPSLPFNTSVIAWEALRDPVTGKCRIDIDAMDVQNDPNVIVIMDDGNGQFMVGLPMVNGHRKPPVKVIGMHRWNGGFNVPGVTAPFGMSLPSGLVAEAATLSFMLRQADRPKAYAVTMRADTTNAVREFDENNNSGAACKAVP